MRVFESTSWFLSFVLVLALGACTTKPIYSIDDTPVVAATGKSLDASQVRVAIVGAGATLGWQIVEVSPGLLQGTLKLRDHTAVVDIPYSASKYSIRFKSGINLEEKDGQINKRYNLWVRNLDKAIRALLAVP